MSGARSVGGIRPMAGRREKRVYDDPSCSKRDLKKVREGYYDFRREHGLPTPEFNHGLPRERVRRARPEKWQRDFLKGFERTGSIRLAATKASVAESTVNHYLRRHPEFREEAALAHGAYLWRQIERGTRHAGSRFVFAGKKLKALAAYMNKVKNNDKLTPR